MKTLENQTLLYDEDCPLCNFYTKGFIKTKLLDNNGRKPYCDLDTKEQEFIDIKRATNEIALINTKDKTVIYGIDSLIKVMGYSFPFLEYIGNLMPVKFLLKKLYSFISYNRKVIIPNKENKNQKLQCVPDFNFKYRCLYIIFATLVTSMVCQALNKTVNIIPESNYLTEPLIIIGQMVFQTTFLIKMNSEKRLNYLGNLMTISLFGSLIVIPILILNSIILVNSEIILSCLVPAFSFMLYEHNRRVRLLQLPKYLSLTFFLYWAIILITYL